MHRAPVDVYCVTLDEFTASNPVVTLIRIDAHGAELDVLDGCGSLIRQNENVALMVKFGPARLRRAGHTTRDWLSRFEALGLAYRVIDDETGVPESWSEEKLDRVESVDLLFARPGVEVWQQGRDVAVKEHVIVLGAGGHAKVVIEILQANGETVDYCVSRTARSRYVCGRIGS